MISEKIPLPALIKKSIVEYISDIMSYYPSSATNQDKNLYMCFELMMTTESKCFNYEHKQVLNVHGRLIILCQGKFF